MPPDQQTPSPADEIRAAIADPYAADSGALRLPKDRFPQRASDPRRIYNFVHDELLLDGVSRMNLATFCTTWVEPEVGTLMSDCLDKNIVDKDEYPQTAALEARCVSMLADLWRAPNIESACGTSTTGSSEAAMLAGLAAKFRWRRRGGRGGGAGGRPNIVSGPVQVCWEKFARYFDVELREVPMVGERFLLTPEEAVKHCDENTITVVATLGQTFTGMYEDVAAISAALDTLQAEKGVDVDLHIDAASGGFLAPFVQPDLVWDFRLPRVKSINASGHKMGLAPLGCGWVLWRDSEALPEELIFNVNYLGGSMPTFNLNFSRPGGQVVAQYYLFARLGRDGYRSVHAAAYETAQYLALEVGEMGPFDVMFGGDPSRGITAVSWRIVPGDESSFSLFDFADRLRSRGWLVPAYTLPPQREDLAVQRILVRHGFSLDMADLLLDDMRRTLSSLSAAPPAKPASGEAHGAFTHDATPAVRDEDTVIAPA
ncbi:MAG: glutamate decarboxylase [Candidatus Dormibacteraeota bacterium]|uniref:Glutamate decarboxylase n=1 Tax=Candidatus Amunia macphersoniae TaxID=3127014 RepID=A0A934KJV8_9BACT|nr:glutamate decarboxylase [Candidatus Dormibacteraeota bacterium]